MVSRRICSGTWLIEKVRAVGRYQIHVTDQHVCFEFNNIFCNQVINLSINKIS